MIRTAPFYGRGIAFPLRVNARGGLQLTEGKADGISIGLEYVSDRYSIREDIPDADNHIAEAMEHILLTHPGEHDTCPEFGSRVHHVIFDPNNEQSRQEFETWVEVATQRWEKRAWIPVPEGVQWKTTDAGIDRGEAPIALSPEAITTQVAGNLVAPFVTPRQARSQEHPLGDVDAEGHDWASRYHGMAAYTVNGERFIRHRKTKQIPPRSDDIFEEVRHGDTWLLLSHRVYNDNRFWWLIVDAYVQDAAKRGEPRSAMDTTGDPAVGTLLRMPSRTRVLMELAA